MPSFELTIDALRFWSHNRIAWAGAREVPAALDMLVTRLGARLREAGFRIDERPYVPHITLVRDTRRAPAERVLERIVWRATDFVLVESVRHDNRTAYQVLERWPLAG
jgi:RNA 2',3'-cyclic 3'-phosphodiesterase